MQLNYHHPEYYHALFNKICDMPEGETPLNHKDAEQKEKFDNHVKHWITCHDFEPLGFYISFNNEYTSILKFTFKANLIKQME